MTERILSDFETTLLKLVIKFSWGNQTMKDYNDARQLAIKTLGLSDERPLDMQKRKDALNAFLRDGEIGSKTKE
jgi:hypothetical protein